MSSSSDQIAHIAAAVPALPPPEAPEELHSLARTYGGSLLNYHRVVAQALGILEAQAGLVRSLATPTDELSSTDRCLIGLMAAIADECPYLGQMVRFNLRSVAGEDSLPAEETITGLWEGFDQPPADGRIREICRYARRVASNPRAVTPEDFSRLRGVGLSEPAILEIVQIVAYCRYVAVTIQGLGIQSDLDEESLNRRLANVRQPS